MADIGRRRLLMWSAGGLLLSFSGSLFAATDILSAKLSSGKGRSRLAIETAGRVRYRYFMLDTPNRLVVDIEDIAPNKVLSSLAGQVRANDPLIASIRIGKKDERTVRLVADLRGKAQVAVSNSPLADGQKHLLQVELTAPNAAAPAPAVAPAAAAVPAAADDPIGDLAQKHSRKATPAAQDKAKERDSVAPAAPAEPAPAKPVSKRRPIIMLDPGHGGKDTGAIGPNGVREKDVVLAVAKETQKLLEAQGYRVFLTRNDDQFIQLRDRRQKARQAKADLFVSIHTNSALSKAASGIDVFMWGQANSEAVRKLAEKENDADLVDGLPQNRNKEVNVVLTDMLQSQTANDSRRLGNLVLGQLGRRHRLHQGRVEQANFVVLRSLDIPSILVELAFVSNPTEEKLLSETAFRRKMAAGISEGVSMYLKKNKLG